MADNLHRIGIDLGGTKTEVLLLGPDGKQIHRERRPTPRTEDPEQEYADILRRVTTLIRDAGQHIPRNAPFTVGIGIPGTINPQTGTVQNANTTSLINKPFQSDLEQELGRTVAMENDANCFTLAECRAGAGQHFGIVFGIIMGTGCGGGLCINGKIHNGAHRIAGEWGHFSVDPDGMPCYCGNNGCVETKLSGSGVEAQFRDTYGYARSMEAISAGHTDGDPHCRAAFEQFLDDFGRCLGGLISILDPDAVVLGGGLSNIHALYTQGREAVRRYAFHRRVDTPILKNRLGDSAGVFGAAWIGR